MLHKLDPYSPFEEYLAWRDEQICSGCGKRLIDRPRDENGLFLDTWVTETECWDCFIKRTDHA